MHYRDDTITGNMQLFGKLLFTFSHDTLQKISSFWNAKKSTVVDVLLRFAEVFRLHGSKEIKMQKKAFAKIFKKTAKKTYKDKKSRHIGKTWRRPRSFYYITTKAQKRAKHLNGRKDKSNTNTKHGCNWKRKSY